MMDNSKVGSKRQNIGVEDNGRDGTIHSDNSNASVRSKRNLNNQTLHSRVDMAGNLELSGQEVSTTAIVSSSELNKNQPIPSNTACIDGVSVRNDKNDSSIESRLSRFLREHPDNERALWLAKKLSDRKKNAEKQRKGPTSRFSLSRNVESLGSASKLDLQALYGKPESTNAPSEGHSQYLAFNRKDSLMIISERQESLSGSNDGIYQTQLPTPCASTVLEKPPDPSISSPLVVVMNGEQGSPSLDSPSIEYEVGSSRGWLKLIHSIEHEYVRDGRGSDGASPVNKGFDVDRSHAFKDKEDQSEPSRRVQHLQSDLEKASRTELIGANPIVGSKVTVARIPKRSTKKNFESDLYGSAEESTNHNFRLRRLYFAVCFLVVVGGIVGLTMWILKKNENLDL